jgi:bifunctional non-homologous end joining protein LigD
VTPAPSSRLPPITHPERVLWPDEGITKGELAAYYRQMAPTTLPHLRGRPLVMRPFPGGISRPAYYRQSLPRTAPAWLARFRYTAHSDRRVNEMLVVDGEPALRWLVNQSAIELHPWLSRTDAPDLPDFVVFDLDVVRPELFDRALAVAGGLRGELDRLGLRGYPKTSGGDGLHVYVPVDRGPTYAQTRAWALALARRLERAHPDLVSTDSRIAGREHRVLVDYGQNALGRTTVAAYSVRPRHGAPVSTPLTWDEVEQGRVRPAQFTLRTVPERVAAHGDLFAPVLAGGQRLTDPVGA